MADLYFENLMKKLTLSKTNYVYKIDNIFLKVTITPDNTHLKYLDHLNNWCPITTIMRCQGCIYDQPNQLAHMDPGGCLSDSTNEWDSNAVNYLCRVWSLNQDQLKVFLHSLKTGTI